MDDIAVFCDRGMPPVIREGEYEAMFLKAEKKELWGQPKLFLWFKVVTHSDYFGQHVYMACPNPSRMRPACKYWKMWVVAAGRKPVRGDRMSTSVFRNKVFLVRIRTVQKNSKQAHLPPELQYSVIDELMKKNTGE